MHLVTFLHPWMCLGVFCMVDCVGTYLHKAINTPRMLACHLREDGASCCCFFVFFFCLAFCAIAALFWLLRLSLQSSPVMEEKVNPTAAS